MTKQATKTTANKTTARKVRTVKKPEAQATEAQATEVQATEVQATEVQQISLYTRIVDALMQRAQHDETSDNQRNEIERSLKKLDDRIVTEACKRMNETDWETFLQIIGATDKSNLSRYTQTKTIEKVIGLMVNIAQGLLPKNNNLRIGLITMYENDKHANVAELICAQSSKARGDVDALRIRDSIKVRSNYSKGTASSQTGQVRDLVRILGLASVRKGGRADDAQFTEYGLRVIGELIERAA